ncbi:DUF2913 family protein [Salmonella enterica subsp. enterica serovar Oranienburg]|nr:DUF2913 family protein [Salmonella enterica]EBR8190107.1 hypothetical protein [Salmonella enterica subsp. enterica serovar Oranienburg]ECA5643506.1 DUF2913 family protein [Salmonella enterica subsp. enterica serovar Saintpaul]EAP2379884.1 DUF2913 family protein [Salmonella enterica]EAP3023841.1 DUF2913 family protein [Salmonella enterica]
MVVCGRKLFLRIVASDLNWLFGEGRRKGSNANLKFTIEYLKSTCHKDVRAQALLFRFTHATGALKNGLPRLSYGSVAILMRPGMCSGQTISVRSISRTYQANSIFCAWFPNKFYLRTMIVIDLHERVDLPFACNTVVHGTTANASGACGY